MDARYPIPSYTKPDLGPSRTVGRLTYAAAVVVTLVVPGGSNQGQQYQAVQQIPNPQVQLGPRVTTGFRAYTPPAPPPLSTAGQTQTVTEGVTPAGYQQQLLGPRLFQAPAAPIVYNDSQSGTITLSGTGVDSFIGPSATVALQGSTTNGPIQAVPRDVGVLVQPASQPFVGAAGSYAPPPPVIPTSVLLQGTSNQNFVFQQVPQPGPLLPNNPQPQVFVYYNAAPPVYHVIVPGTTNQFYVFQTYSTAEVSQVSLGSRRAILPPAAPIVYNDSGSGTITLGGTGADAFSTPPPPLAKAGQQFNVAQAVAAVGYNQVQLGPRSAVGTAQPIVYNDSGSGTITLGGSGADTFTVVPPGIAKPGQSAQVAASVTPTGYQQILLGARTFSPPAAPITYTDSQSGIITLGGSSVEAFSTPPPRLARAGQQFNVAERVRAVELPQNLLGSRRYAGAAAGTVFNDSQSGTITLGGTFVQSQSHTASRTATVTFTGTGVEDFFSGIHLAYYDQPTETGGFDAPSITGGFDEPTLNDGSFD